MQQLSLIHDQKAASLGGIRAAIKAAMRRAAARTNLSRDEILDAMNDYAREHGICLTRGNAKALGMATLEKWLNPNDRDFPPPEGMHVFSLVVQDISFLDVQARVHGCRVINGDDAKLLRKQQILQEIQEKKKELKRLEALS